jgi:hypothetical protein
MITGVLWDHANKSGRAVTLMGEATIAGLGIGGGPIMPPDMPVHPEHPIPPTVWPTPPPSGGAPPHPAHPIPPTVWPTPPMPPSGGVPPHPAHPIPPTVWPTPPMPPSGGVPPGKPTFPIWGPPGVELPPGSGYPPVAGHPLPPPGTEEPKPIIGWEAQAVWTVDTGWVVVLVPTDAEVPTPSA